MRINRIISYRMVVTVSNVYIPHNIDLCSNATIDWERRINPNKKYDKMIDSKSSLWTFRLHFLTVCQNIIFYKWNFLIHISFLVALSQCSLLCVLLEFFAIFFLFIVAMVDKYSFFNGNNFVKSLFVTFF